jgi:hypothetical protein
MKLLTKVVLLLFLMVSLVSAQEGIDPNQFPVVFYISSSGTESGVCWMDLQSGGVSYHVRGGEFPRCTSLRPQQSIRGKFHPVRGNLQVAFLGQDGKLKKAWYSVVFTRNMQ